MMKLNIRNLWRSYKKQIKTILKNNSSWLFSVIQIVSPIKNCWASSEEYCSSLPENNLNHPLYFECFNQNSETRQSPITIDQKIHWQFREQLSWQHPTTFVMDLPNGRVLGAVGTILTSDDQLLLDVSLQFDVSTYLEKAKFHRAFQYLRFPPLIQLDASVAVLAVSGGSGYFHWLMDALPRLAILQQTPSINLDEIDHFVINSGIPAIKDSMKKLGIPEEKLIVAHPTLHLQATHLLVPSLPGVPGNPPKWACDFLRQQFLPSSSLVTRPERKIYISRAKTKYRRIVNEAELINYLEQFSFETISLEDLSFEQQVNLFASTAMVIAPHGAGLTNIVFCPENSQILEIFSPSYVNVCYWALANQLNLKYYYLLGQGNRFPDFYDPHLGNADITVELSDLKKILEIMLQA